MTIHPAFQNVRSFRDFQDAYIANDPGIPGVGRNDLVRAYTIARRAREFVVGSSRVDFMYSALNTSQSSVVPVVSKLNRIFRFLGLLPEGRHGTIRIVHNDFYNCVLDFTRINVDAANATDAWLLDHTAGFSGRGQDRTSLRHAVGHRARSRARREALDRIDRLSRESDDRRGSLGSTSYTPYQPGYMLALNLDSFDLDSWNPFANVEDYVFDVLMEAAQ